jgi:hypothetical protein
LNDESQALRSRVGQLVCRGGARTVHRPRCGRTGHDRGPAAPGATGQVLHGRSKIVAHQRQNYFSFRDGSGEIRVEIDPGLWQNRKVGPDDKVRLVGELDQGTAGRYLWVKSLEVLG